MPDLPHGPPEPTVPGSGAATPIGGGWYDVAGEKVRGRDAALAAAEATTQAEPDEGEGAGPYSPSERDEAMYFLAAAGVLESRTFSGPAMSYMLPADVDPDSVTVHREGGDDVRVRVDGRTVTRPSGHFGRGRWTVTYYRPA